MPEQNPAEVSTDDAIKASANYEAPVIESVVTPDDLEREAHYAGAPISNGR